MNSDFDPTLTPPEGWSMEDWQAGLKREKLLEETLADGRKLVTFRVIDDIVDIPGADRIKLAIIGGWKAVVRADEFQPGDLCVYFEVDSFLPPNQERYKFLDADKRTWEGIEGIRLKTKRMRKQLSQGLAMPTHLFPELEEMVKTWDPLTQRVGIESMSFEGLEMAPIADVNLTIKLGVIKWELPMTEEMLKTMKSNYPALVPKTSLDRVQNIGDEVFETRTFEHEGMLLSVEKVPDDTLQWKIDEQVAKGRMIKVGDDYHMYRGPVHEPDRYEVSIKLDGASLSVFSSNHLEKEMQYGIASSKREMRIEGNEDRIYIKDGLPLLEFIKANGEYCNYAFQGELMGPGTGISNKEGLKERVWYIYSIYDINTGDYLAPAERRNMVDEINAKAGYNLLTHIPVLHESVTLADIGIATMDDLLAFAVGPSMNHPDREGLVFKSTDGKRQFKVISNRYLENE